VWATVTIRIRDAHSGDEPSIVRLIQVLAQASGGVSPISEEYVRSYLTCPDNGVLVAEIGDFVGGVISYSIRPGLFHAGSSGLIEELVVLDSARGQGVGSMLLAEALCRLEALGCVEVSVSTGSDNEAALRLYRSHGLVDEAILLEKHL
jgi:ribosomal protein S18 acetylase RimI-like enzyme